MVRNTRLTEAKVLNPRVRVPPNYADVQIGWGYLAIVLVPLVLMVLGAGVSIINVDEVTRPLMVVLTFGAAGLLCAVLGGLAPLWHVRKRVLHIARTGPLRFVSRGFAGPLQWASALCFWVAAALIARSLLVPGAPMVIGVYGEPISMVVLTMLGLVIAAVTTIKGLEPPAIKLDEHGVWIQRQFALNLIPWEDIERVNALADGNLATLEIRSKRGYGVPVPQRFFGSDPYWVAEVISHFLRTPSHRVVLHNPMRALELALVIDPDQSKR